MRPFIALASLLLCALALSDRDASAQTNTGTCTPLVEEALVRLDSACAGLERNSACYGNTLVEAEFTRVELGAEFAAPGDRTGIDDLVSLRTSPLDALREQWGIAALSVQANLPDALPGQNVVFVLIGDVELRADPDTDPNAPPMQAVRISTDFRQGRVCENAPRSLVLAQGPRDTRVNITVNGLDIDMGSTIAIYENADDLMWVATIDGDVRMEGIYPLPAGTGALVQLAEDGRAERVMEVRPLTDDEIAQLAPLADLPPGVLNYPVSLEPEVLAPLPTAITLPSRTFTPTPSPVPTRRPATRAPAVPTAVLTATPLPTASISVSADNPVINYGGCTFIRWQTEFIDSIYFNEEGVVGVGERQVCPMADTTYVIRVRLRDGTDALYPIAIRVQQAAPSATYTHTWTPVPPTATNTPPTLPPPICGNLVCEVGEDVCSCSTDCSGSCIP